MTEADSPSIEFKNVFGVRLYQPCDMPPDILKTCIESTKKHILGLDDFQKDANDAVAKIKEELDTKYGPHWHVIAGKHFGSRVTHEAKRFTFFYLEDKAILIFKSG